MTQETEEGAAGVEVRASWRMLRRTTTKVAFSLQELVGLTSEFSVKWAKNCDSQVIRTDPAKYLMVYRVTCHKKDSNPAGHVVRLKFDFKRMKETGTVDDLDCRVSCSCPAWLYWGQQWVAATGDALYGAPRPKFQPPTDPKRYMNVICKHVKIVADRIAPVLERMLSKHRNTKDRAQQTQNLQDVELEKQRTQQTVEELSQNTEKLPAGQPEPPIPGEPTENGPVTTWGPGAEPAPEPEPDALGDLTLPGQEPVPETQKQPVPKTPKQYLPQDMRDFLKLPPVPGQQAPPPAPPQAPATPAAPPVAPSPKGQLIQDAQGNQGRQVKPNLTVWDEEDEAPRVLPGNKGKLVLQDKQPSNVTRHDEDTRTLKLPGKVVRDQDTRGRKLPPNLKVHDDEDDSTIRLNSSLHALMAGLSVAAAEGEAPASATPIVAGRHGALLLAAAPGRLGTLVLASRSATSGTTS